jgi:hypothetical protein
MFWGIEKISRVRSIPMASDVPRHCRCCCADVWKMTDYTAWTAGCCRGKGVVVWCPEDGDESRGEEAECKAAKDEESSQRRDCGGLRRHRCRYSTLEREL